MLKFCFGVIIYTDMALFFSYFTASTGLFRSTMTHPKDATVGTL